MKAVLCAWLALAAATSPLCAEPAARERVETFVAEELGRQTRGEAIPPAEVRRWCTAELAHLLEIETARQAAFYEGFAAAEPGPGRDLKPPFADAGYFLSRSPEGTMKAAAAAPEPHGDAVEVKVSMTSSEAGRTYDHGWQAYVLRREAGEWRIADVRFEDGALLTALLKRPKFMEIPGE